MKDSADGILILFNFPKLKINFVIMNDDFEIAEKLKDTVDIDEIEMKLEDTLNTFITKVSDLVNKKTARLILGEKEI